MEKNNDKKDKKDFSSVLGTIVGNVVIICIAACTVAVVLGITLKFLNWLFQEVLYLLKRLSEHFERWNVWRKHSTDHSITKILVLFGVIQSPTFYRTLTKREIDIFMKGFKNAL